MVIEILSPSTAYYDLRYEKEIYAMHGVKEYWIVDPIERVSRYMRTGIVSMYSWRGDKDR